MNYLHRLEHWGDTHHAKWLDIVRIALGIFLCYKAFSFLGNMSVLLGILGGSNMGFGSFALVLIGQFIVIIHLMGGLFIAIGLHTRLACLTQMPILAGAIVLLKASGSSIGSAEIIITAVVLLLLLVFLVEGNGPWSYDKLFREETRQRT
jgi:uncharacterized membrane protein YphA (DoxX/SURF4 family)